MGALLAALASYQIDAQVLDDARTSPGPVRALAPIPSPQVCALPAALWGDGESGRTKG
jgi:hypothetical protein